MNDKEPCWPCEEDVIEKLPPCPLQCRSEKCKSFKKVSLEGIPIVWVLGGPGSGKSIQCSKILSKYQFIQLMPDALVREEVKSGSVRGKCLSKILERNDTAPSDVIVDLLKDAIYKYAKSGSAKGFLLDGFPKEKSQAVIFEKRIRPCTEELIFKNQLRWLIDEDCGPRLRDRALGAAGGGGSVGEKLPSFSASLPKVIFYLEASSDTLTRRVMSREPGANELVVKQRVKATFEVDELLLAAFCDKAFRINAEVDPETVFGELSGILDTFIPKSTDAKPLPQ